MIYFTADLHFLHENILNHGRPFSTYKEMEDALISNWNERVTNADVIYVLGDFALSYGKKSAADIDRVLRQLNGQKFLIKGNHDRKEVTSNKRWTQVVDYKEIKTTFNEEKINIVMMHYPLLSWNKGLYGAIMLHGHCHGNLEVKINNLIDVGVDANNYAPVSLEEIIKRRNGGNNNSRK